MTPDFRVCELAPRIVHLRLAGGDGSLAFRDERVLRLQLLLGHERLRVELDEPLQVRPGGRQLRLILPLAGLHLVEANLVGQRIDLREQLPLRDLLASSNATRNNWPRRGSAPSPC